MIIAADSNWDIASDILANPTFAEAVYGIGLYVIDASFAIIAPRHLPFIFFFISLPRLCRNQSLYFH
jgi:hypothetical protein